MGTYRILAIGDSVMWGQGLRDENKFTGIVRFDIGQQLPAGTHVELISFAHSAAQVFTQTQTNLAHDLSPFPPELPLAIEPTIAEIEKTVQPNPDPDDRNKIGEFLNSQPFVWSQLHEAVKELSGTEPDLVLLNAGINDVGIMNLVLPYKIPGCLSDRIASFKGYVYTLLRAIHRDFPSAKIIVLGYFPLISEKSKLDVFLRWAEALWWQLMREHQQHQPDAFPTADFHDLINASLDVVTADSFIVLDTWSSMLQEDFHRNIRCLLNSFELLQPHFTVKDRLVLLSKIWTKRIQEVLEDDVDRFNKEIGHPLAGIATPTFLPENALYAGKSMLWELSPDLEPEDPLAEYRKIHCPDGSLLSRFICHRASMAHPNVEGAKAYSDEIMKAWQRLNS
jgi:hypothetical protein